MKFDGGLSRVPEEVRAALAFACNEAARLCELDQGETALFFNLIAVMGSHIKETHDQEGSSRLSGDSDSGGVRKLDSRRDRGGFKLKLG